MRRAIVLVACAALLGSVLYAPAAAKQTEPPPPTIPDTVIIEDPFQDANGINDQGRPRPEVPATGDVVTPADAGNASDIGKVWFTDDELTITAYVQVQLPPPASQALRIDVYTAVGPDSTLGCARFVTILEGVAQGQQTTWRGGNEAKFFDACNDGTNWFNNGVEAQVAVHALEDGTGVVTITATKDSSPFLATGQTLSGTTVTTRVAYGVSGTVAGSAVVIDNTKPGADYVIAGPPEAEEEELPPGCKKGKGKKKGCKKKG